MGEMWDRNGDGDRSELRTLEAIRCMIDLKCVCLNGYMGVIRSLFRYGQGTYGAFSLVILNFEEIIEAFGYDHDFDSSFFLGVCTFGQEMVENMRHEMRPTLMNTAATSSMACSSRAFGKLIHGIACIVKILR